MRRWTSVLFLAVMAAAPLVAGQPDADNPFLEEWTTPFGAPPFDRITEEDYLPALREGIARQRAEVAAITDQTSPATFENTVGALEASGALLAKVSSVFFNQMSANTSERLQAIAKEISPELSALRDDINLDPALFRRVQSVWQQRDGLELTEEQAKLLDDTYTRFVRGGAELGDQDKARLREINARLALLGLEFGDNVLAETNTFELLVEDSAQLAGLPDALVAAAAEAASERGHEGAWVFTLHAPSIWPFLTHAENRDLRRQLFTGYVTRGDHDDDRDNDDILVEMVRLRAEKAQLLGYTTWADYVLDERMAERPERVFALLWQVWSPALAKAREEAAALQDQIDAEGGGFELEPWDWWYYAEKVRKARYDLDDRQLRPYFQLEKVRDGIFWVAGRLYGLQFTERDDIPTYSEDVRAFEVRDAEGDHVGVILLDYFPRPGKRGGAWSSTYRQQEWRDGEEVRPIVVNCGNFTRPAGGQPALLGLDEVETMFHEFGHALHQLLSKVHYRSLAGSSVPRDFVELPSQIMENWMLEPDVLEVYARHYETGEVIPDELVAKIKASETFNQGFATTEYLAAAFLDMDWHTLISPGEIDPDRFERQSLNRIGLIPEIVVRYKSPYFNHIFGGASGYSSGYYSYVWSEVLDADAFAAFKEAGLFDRETADAFRREILERGGTAEAMDMYVSFRGREPSVKPLLERLGFTR